MSDDVAASVRPLFDSVAAQANQAIQAELPRIIVKIHKLLDKAPFNLTPDEVRTESIASMAAAASTSEDNPKKRSRSGESKSKKQKVSVSASASSAPAIATSDSDSDDKSDGSVPRRPFAVTVQCHDNIAKCMSIVKEESQAVLNCVAAVKTWIQLLVPRVEEGHNFGVAVQEETINVISRVEETTFQCLETTYFHTRAKLVADALKHPDCSDWRTSIVELDDHHYFSTRMSLVDIRNNLMVMLDLMGKNMQRITAPRGSGVDLTASMY